jgi:hypothetical protein
LDAFPSIQAAMTKGALEDLTTCFHYSDDLDPKESGVWDDIYKDPKVVADPPTASHQLKHGQLEDDYIKVCMVVFVVVVVIVLNRFLHCFFLLSVLSSYVAVASFC